MHADIHVRNLVTRDGRLSAILDWGESGAGDPAQDIGQLWLLLDSADAEEALDAYGPVDGWTLRRARGEALVTAARLMSTKDPGFVASAWRGLTNLGLATGDPPSALDEPADQG